MAYPVRWLHCQSAQHLTVTSDAPLLDYKGLNPWSCQFPMTGAAEQLLVRLSPRTDSLVLDMLRFCTETPAMGAGYAK